MKKLVLLLAMVMVLALLLESESGAMAAAAKTQPAYKDIFYIALVNDSGKVVAAAAVPAGHPNIDLFTVNLGPDDVPIAAASAKNCGNCHALPNPDMTALIDSGGSGSDFIRSAWSSRDGPVMTAGNTNNADIIYTVFTVPASGQTDARTAQIMTALGFKNDDIGAAAKMQALAGTLIHNDFQLAFDAPPVPGRLIMLVSTTSPSGQPSDNFVRHLAASLNDAATVTYPGNASFMASNLLLDNGSISPAYANGGGTVPRNPVPNMTASAAVVILNSVIGPMAAIETSGAHYAA